jgi:hypothetical protein
MRFLIGFFAFVITVSASSMVYAEPKPWIWSWWPGHWENLDFEPYLEPAKHPHNSQWDESDWQPEHWISQRKDAIDTLQGFYFADVLRGQYYDDDLPVLEVGPAFYRLGGHDKRRVTALVDSIYEVTTSRPNGMFMLYDWKSKKPVGAYTQHGLQIQ